MVKSALSSLSPAASAAAAAAASTKQTKSGRLRGRQSPKSFPSARRKTASVEASSDSDSLVFAVVASPPNGYTEAGEAVHHAKEFMKTSATIQDFRCQNSYEKNKAKLGGGREGWREMPSCFELDWGRGLRRVGDGSADPWLGV